MEYSKDTANVQFDSNSIQKILVTQLKQLRQKSPESFSKEVHVLPDINGDDEHELEQQLQEEREADSEKRILLIPCCLENLHWVGLLIEFQAADQVLRAEYFDPVSGSNDALHILQNQLAKVYPSAVLQPKDLHKNNDRRLSSTVTIKNLLAAVETNQRSSYPNQETSPGNSLPLNISTSVTFNPIPGNDYELSEKKQELNTGLNKFKSRVDMLSQKIKRTEERIRDFEEEDRRDDAKKERAILNELQRLQNLVNEIAELNRQDDRLKLRQLKEELENGLAKYRIRDEAILLQRIKRTEERIEEYESEGRTEAVEKERTILNELERLQDLVNEIAELTQQDDRIKLRQLKEELDNELAKYKIRDEAMLLQRIERTEERIEEYENEGRTQAVDKERTILKEFQRLQNLVNEIAELTQQDDRLKLRQLKEELDNGLAKYRIRDEAILLQRIKRTEERIEEYENEGRTQDVEQEITILNELQRLQKLLNEIAELTQKWPMSQQNDNLKVRQLKEELDNGLAKYRIRDEAMLLQRIKNTEKRIKDYEDEERMDDVQKEMSILNELQRLRHLANETGTWPIATGGSSSDSRSKPSEQYNQSASPLSENNTLNSTEKPSKPVTSASHRTEPIKDPPQLNTSSDDKNDSETPDNEKKKVLHINELRAEVNTLPSCARKTVIELLVHFEKTILGENVGLENQDTLMSSLQKLKDQVKREELLSDNIKTILHDLTSHFTTENYSVIVSYLNDLLKKFRSLNVPEIQRLVAKAKEAAELIQNKDVILLIGTTGAGKSTTIQFLAGAKMEHVKVEISPGRYLEHVTAVGPIKNPDLKNVISSPYQKSETRYIAPVTIQLKDILGPQESGIITLCDAPGFEDTAGPEVDIANSIGIIEALKTTKSVKILALSSLKGLGDRGQGIQKLAHILISMVHGIENKLDALVYVFTKYPETTDINPLLVEIKRAKVDEDPTLQSDTAFVSVLKDMIEKTEYGAFKIEPTKDDPKKLLTKLNKVKGIENPEEVFQFSMSEQTRASISDHVQRDKFSVICAMKNKDNALVLYYLNDLQTLKDLIKESFIRDAYEESVRLVSESISNYCAEIKEKFNRALASQDGLQKKDILDYKTFIKYLEGAQMLKKHLESSLLSPASMLQNIITELNKISRNLNEVELHSSLVTIYLQNLYMLKNSFTEVEANYSSSCKIFQKRFDELVESAREFIPQNDFRQIAEVLQNIFQSALVLKNHLNERVQGAYGDTVKYLLQYLSSFSQNVQPLLVKIRLSRPEVETIKNYMEILRSAKENATLQECVSKYLKISRKKAESSDERESLEERIIDLNEIYNEFIVKIIKYFEQINLRIKELFEKNGDQALEQIKSLVNDMDALRTIPELEAKTAGTYFQTVENIRSYMQQLQADTEKLLIAIDQQTGITNYKHLSRSLARLRNAEWINEVSPGTFDNLMRRITEELVQYASQLHESLMKIDFSLKCPENVSVAAECVEKIESMRDLERSVPELKKYRDDIVKQFSECAQSVFDRIQKTFNLQDKDVYEIKKQLKELEEIKRQYESLHPARLFLQNQGYADINMLISAIEELKAKQKAEIEAKETSEREKEAELNQLNTIVREYQNIPFGQKVQAGNYLQKLGYARIELVYNKITKIERDHNNKIQQIQEQITGLNISLNRLESLKKEHDLLLTTQHSSPEEVRFLREKGFKSYELLEEAIQEKTKVINQRGKGRQDYHFTDRLDASTANNALVYITRCEAVRHYSIKGSVMDANENLKKYIREYGVFLNQEINKKFIHIRSIDSEGGPFMYSQDLEMRLQELSSFSRFPHVFEHINGIETIERWQQQFLDCHRDLSAKMEEYKVAGRMRELRDQLIFAQALACVDRFCATVFVGNGFAVLYRQYQGEINKECRVAYRKVLDHISKGDYANADMAIGDIDENPLNQRDKAQIQYDLQSSLNKLMKDTRSIVHWLDGKIERENNRAQITEIKENIDKIRIACNKRRIIELLDPTTQKNLQAFDDEINDIFARIILRGLRCIEEFMKADSFAEAEQGMENLSQVQRQLGGYCTSEAVMKKSEELRGRLDSIVSEVLERNEFSDINKFSINPPKDLLARLKAVNTHGSAKFTQAYTQVLGKTRQTFSLAIEEVRKAPLNERSVKIRTLNYALCFLPEDLQTGFKLQIEELSKLIANEVDGYRQELDTSFTTVDEDEHAITKIGLLADRYSKQNMHDLLKTLREQCTKKLQMCRANVQKSLDEQNIQSAIDTVKKILKYEECVGSYIPEIKGIGENVRTLVIRRFSSFCDTLSNISTIEQTQIVEKAFTDILIYLEFSNTSNKRIEEFFPADAMQNAREAFQKISEYLIGNSEKFQVALKDKNVNDLYKIISISKKWQNFLTKVSQCSLNHNLVQNLLRQIRKITPYKDMISDLEQMVDRLKNPLNVEFISDETIRFGIKRDELFSNLIDAFNLLKNINIRFRDILSSPIDIDRFEREIKGKVEKIKTQLMTRASRVELSPKDADDFRMYYNHLVSFDKYVHLPGIDIKQVLEDSQDKIFAKVNSSKQEIIKSITDAAAVSVLLIKIKFFAENLSMFEKYINDEIDSALKRYKESQGSAGIAHLSMELEKTEVGARLIGEHSSLSGEDWRKRREKMQKQDDIDYVLQNLTGTDLSKDILRARYNTFKEQYNLLLSTFLKTLKQDDKNEPDLEVLISQTKHLVGTVTQTPNSVIWTRPFKEDIPVLLAHIFAVWTLKNTQHYNSMRGIDEANAYLLMPHVGQVISIFRLLGIGYEKKQKIPLVGITYSNKISDDLVNNLVEVGTGEGKSVVLAITACIFALTGVDVNCSCYSEVLSARDKDDFASVFRALGIEDRIEYGTFNKLCEQLLNEQCNVREKVRDMIVTNKSTLDATDTSSRIRPKILLIDEVDVFLSDKYYGGMYIPTVCIKEPAIKALLDSIWENKTLRSLKGVKALPAYQTCATKYSNWIFLFDEAIKDMIAALQSYQSSTYIVQNDKIVYVEGESIVDNVVRGYDTIWTYYHEKKKGNISQTSLEDNVGILINCGTFSYAEMPHDFAYIGGVTGTLKTLAGVEKKILEKVYAINKETFMPSVFGSSNRSYNPMTDVRVVTESEYFMEIYGEIRLVCYNAKRAILVFFESEEKLMAFYNSPEMSTSKQDVQIITEKVSVKDRELYNKRAATVGKVTLLTRTFGRGTDFICRNQQLLVSGGIHVLQTFFSAELSEEYQIMGRGARQGDKGSYRMILLDKDLEWVLGSSWKEYLPKIMGSTLYQALNKARSALYESKCGAKELGIEQCKTDHKSSKEFMNALTSGNIEVIKKLLTKQNQGANLVTASSRTVLLMDATGSMSGLLSAAKETVCTMFERASTVLSEKGLPNDAFQMQFVVYRDYDCREDGLLQSSSWETKPNNLRNFMASITAMGGGDYEEAIEIGLWHAVQQSEQPDSISQIILIGDAPAKDKVAITRDRQSCGGEAYWNKTKFKTPTHYAEELETLKKKEIPVHAFYLHDGAKNNFQKISSETSGRCEKLDINSPQGAASLTNFVTEEVLRKTAGNQGDAVVELYRRKYISFTS